MGSAWFSAALTLQGDGHGDHRHGEGSGQDPNDDVAGIAGLGGIGLAGLTGSAGIHCAQGLVAELLGAHNDIGLGQVLGHGEAHAGQSQPVEAVVIGCPSRFLRFFRV